MYPILSTNTPLTIFFLNFKKKDLPTSVCVVFGLITLIINAYNCKSICTGHNCIQRVTIVTFDFNAAMRDCCVAVVSRDRITLRKYHDIA